jgi:hypothetical protein
MPTGLGQATCECWGHVEHEFWFQFTSILDSFFIKILIMEDIHNNI